MKLRSKEFQNKEKIPEKYGYSKENINPPLELSNIPENTKSLVLIMDDPDALEPAGKVWDHWVLYDIKPDTKMIEEGEEPGTPGRTDYGKTTYGGPNPPDGEHTYVFKAYALNEKLDLEKGATKQEVEKAMQDKIIEKTRLEGTYEPV